MYRNKLKAGWAALILVMVLGLSQAHAAWYERSIDYRQAVSKILGRGDVSWGDNADNYYNYSYVTVSADGTKVLFTAACEFCDKSEVRPFLVNPDGTGLQDISDMLPDDITNRWSGWRNLIINDDGTKVFFRARVEAGYYDDEYLYVYNVGAGARQLAVAKQGGFSPFSTDWLFPIDTTGSRVYMDKYDAGWSETLGKNRKGLFYADTGGPMQWYLDLDDLPCESQCGNLNLFTLMDVSARNDRAFFQWNSDSDKTDGSDQHTRLYYTDLNGVPVPLSDEHWTIYNGDWRGITDTEGTRVIYRYIQEYGDPQKLVLVDLVSNTSRQVAWTSRWNGFDAHLSRSGRQVLVNGEYGDHGTYYQTLLDLDADTARDTWSYHFTMGRWGSTSNLTADDRYYFYAIDKWAESAENAGLYRIDTRTTGDDTAPYVHSIQFSAPALLDREDTTIAVQVKISDPQGLGTIEQVILLPLVEGQETTSWAMAREPLAFPSGGIGSTLLYDDGTHGDAVAGDGIYSFDSIATRQYDRQKEGWNTWYSHYDLPADVGIRVVVRDADNNYGIADTTLQITDIPVEPAKPSKAVLVSPSLTMDSYPAFTWQEDAASTWYRLFIWDSSQAQVYSQWHASGTVCSGGTCSVSLASKLAAENYEWWIKTWNDYGSVWSDGMQFAVQGNETPPSKAVLVSPSGIAAQAAPVFTWQKDTAATWYRLFVWDSSEAQEYSQWHASDTVCSGSTCSITLGSDLAAGSYEWWIETWNDYGNVWSDGAAFTVQSQGSVPAKIALLSASATMNGTGPAFTWKPDAAATWYRLFVQNQAKTFKFSQWYEIADNSPGFPEADCTASECTVPLEESFGDDTYTWWVKGWNEQGNGEWSNGMQFVVENAEPLE